MSVRYRPSQTKLVVKKWRLLCAQLFIDLCCLLDGLCAVIVCVCVEFGGMYELSGEPGFACES